jgi:hypothetical protein
MIDGPVINTRADPFEAWMVALAEIHPTRIQIYSTDRPVAEPHVRRVPPTTLRRIAQVVERYTGRPVDAYWS